MGVGLKLVRLSRGADAWACHAWINDVARQGPYNCVLT